MGRLRWVCGQFALSSVEATPERLAASDAVIVAADHDAFDYPEIARHAPVVIDTRGRYREPADNIVRA